MLGHVYTIPDEFLSGTMLYRYRSVYTVPFTLLSSFACVFTVPDKYAQARQFGLLLMRKIATSAVKNGGEEGEIYRTTHQQLYLDRR